MATSFDVIYLGTHADINPVEGNTIPDNAQVLEGVTIGSAGAPLWQNVQTFALGTDDFNNGSYGTDNSIANDTFTIDGGAEQVFDSVARYTSTINYSDGSNDVAIIDVVQDTAGQLYLVPQRSDDVNQQALEAHPIESMTLNSYAGSYYAGTSTDFEPATFATPICLAAGTGVRTPSGYVSVERLRPGDLVTTADNGPCVLRWVCCRKIDFTDPENHRAESDRPICFSKGALGGGLPTQDMAVSPQHRMYIDPQMVDQSPQSGVLVPAKGLLGQPGVRKMHGKRHVAYFALVFDCHQLIYAEGALVESFRPGPIALQGLRPSDLRAVLRIYPGLRYLPDIAIGPPARPLWSIGRYLKRSAGPQTQLCHA